MVLGSSCGAGGGGLHNVLAYTLQRKTCEHCSVKRCDMVELTRTLSSFALAQRGLHLSESSQE